MANSAGSTSTGWVSSSGGDATSPRVNDRAGAEAGVGRCEEAKSANAGAPDADAGSLAPLKPATASA